MAGTGYGSGLGTLSRRGSELRAEMGQAPGVEFDMSFEPSSETLGMAFAKWASLISDWRPVWTDVVALFRRHEARHLDSGGESTGAGFVALSPAYKAWKDRNYPGKPILTLRGALRLALVEGKGPSALERSSKDGLEVGVSGGEVGVYASAHAFGQGGLPVRPPVRYDATVKGGGSIGGGSTPFGTAVAQIFQIHIVNARKKALAAEGVPQGVIVDTAGTRSAAGILNLKTR